MSELGRLAYEAYNKHAVDTGFVMGTLALPFWPELPEGYRALWDAAADAVAAKVEVADLEAGLDSGTIPGGF